MREVRTIEDQYGYGRQVRAWDCDCGTEVQCYPGEREVECSKCGQPFNPFGQALRRDWRNNPSNYDDEIGDMEGYEMEHGGDW